MASKLLDKVNLDLILSKDNADYIKKLMIENKHGVFNASFLPFLGCKINIIPVKYNEFLGVVLIFEAITEMDFNFDQTDNIVSILSSNLRLPMHLITNAVDILNYDVDKLSVPDKEKMKKSISVVENNTYKMYRVCKNLSELIRFSNNTNSIDKTVVKISDYINNLIDKCCDYIRLSGLNVVYNFSSLSDAPIWMTIDCEKIDLAISNIILNSCQYSFKNKKITISVTITKYYLTIIIQDEGFGIPKDKIEDVFRPYTSLKNKHYVSQGMGIGLTLAKYIINKHDGTINIESEEDIGTTVTINIPIVCDVDNNVVRLNSGVTFKSKMSTLAIQFSPLIY